MVRRSRPFDPVRDHENYRNYRRDGRRSPYRRFRRQRSAEPGSARHSPQRGFRPPLPGETASTVVTKHWACSRADIDWKAEGIRSSALEFVAYSLGFFHDRHRAASDCRATVHALAQRLPGTGRLALLALLGQARMPTWRLWARDAVIEKKDLLKTRGYSWSPGDNGRPKCWYRDVSDPEKAAEAAWLRANVMGVDQAVWALRI